MRTAFHFVLAVGLSVEALLALRHRRVLPPTQLATVVALGGFGVIVVLSKSFQAGLGTARAVAGVWVLLAFIACLIIDVLNRRSRRATTGARP